MADPRENPARRVRRQATAGFLLVAFFSFFANLSVLVSPIYMQQIFDRVLQTRHVETLVYLTMITAGLLLALGAIDTLRAYALARLGRWWDESLREDLLSAAVKAARTSSRAETTAVSDLQTVRHFVGSPNLFPFFDAPWMPLFIGAIFLLHPILGMLAVAAAAILIGLAIITEAGTKRIMKGVAERQGAVQVVAHTAMRHADSVHAMGLMPGVLQRYQKHNEPVVEATQRVADFTAMVGGITKFVRLMVQILVLGIGAYLATRMELTSGGMIAASIILGRALSPAEQALGAWKGFVAAREAHQRIAALFDRVGTDERRMRLPAPRGAVEMSEASFVIPGQDRAILRNVTLSFAPGSVVALIGPSGSGKSTLCKLLIGALRPTAGSIRLDGASVSQWDPNQWGETIGYLPQSVDLFPGTVRENIARLKEASDEDVVAAAQIAGCHEMILRLPKGYDTEVGDGGALLSGGQRQRVGLARAAFGGPRLVILDEPNSNLDGEGEAALTHAIAGLKALGVTVVIVSHRLTLLASVDTVVTVKDGMIEKVAPREAMLRDALRPVAAKLSGAGRPVRPVSDAAQAN